MAVIHPRRAAFAVPDGPERVVRYADPPVDYAALPDLAAELGAPVALLRAIHDAYSVIFTEPERQIRSILNPAPAVAAAYAAAANTAGALPRNELPAVLRPSARSKPHRLADEWSIGSGNVAVLRACRSCGSTRRAVMRLPEVTGSLCLHCRTDRAGVSWDPGYDRFVDHPRAGS